MNYQMLGDDSASAEDRIKKYTGEVVWSYLEPHCKSGSLYWVDPALDITAVAAALQADDALQISRWLGVGDLVKVGPLHSAQWQGSQQLFTAVVVTPFVLMQEH